VKSSVNTNFRSFNNSSSNEQSGDNQAKPQAQQHEYLYEMKLPINKKKLFHSKKDSVEVKSTNVKNLKTPMDKKRELVHTTMSSMSKTLKLTYPKQPKNTTLFTSAVKTPIPTAYTSTISPIGKKTAKKTVDNQIKNYSSIKVQPPPPLGSLSYPKVRRVDLK
jgi:hypothetical protein